MTKKKITQQALHYNVIMCAFGLPNSSVDI